MLYEALEGTMHVMFTALATTFTTTFGPWVSIGCAALAILENIVYIRSQGGFFNHIPRSSQNIEFSAAWAL